jgi:hypothetical protein
MKHRVFAAGLVVALLIGGVFSAPIHGQLPGYREWDNLHMVYVRADWTDGSGGTTLQAIPDLTFSLPGGQTGPFKIDCDLYYSQATNVADNFGVKFSSNPTNAEFGGIAATNATAFAAGTPANITNTTATNVITMTPAVTTVLYAHIGGLVENAGTTDNVVNIMVAQSTAADVIVVKRGSACTYHSMN